MNYEMNKGGFRGISEHAYHGPADLLNDEPAINENDSDLAMYIEHRAEDMGPARYRKDWA